MEQMSLKERLLKDEPAESILHALVAEFLEKNDLGDEPCSLYEDYVTVSPCSTAGIRLVSQTKGLILVQDDAALYIIRDGKMIGGFVSSRMGDWDPLDVDENFDRIVVPETSGRADPSDILEQVACTWLHAEAVIDISFVDVLAMLEAEQAAQVEVDDDMLVLRGSFGRIHITDLSQQG